MAVYTQVSADELDQFLSNYDIGHAVAFKGIAEGVENSNYLLVTHVGVYILTIYEKRVNPADLPYFLGLMEHVAGKGVKCPLPVHNKAGLSLTELNGRPACVISFLNGMSVKKIEAEQCAATGKALAEFHLAARDFDGARANALSLEGWQDLASKTSGRADEVMEGLSKLVADEITFLSSHWHVDLPSGVIHADLFPDNAFFLDGAFSGMIDFYFACNDLLAYDLAICVNAWCFERDGSLNVTKASRMMNAYAKVRPLSDAEKDAFPLLCRGAALRFLLTRLYDWLNPAPGALVTPKDPLEYARKLKFHQEAESVAAYGLFS